MPNRITEDRLVIKRRVAQTEDQFRRATCEEVDCTEWREGWRTVLPVGHDLVEFVRSGKTGRRFTEHVVGEGLIEFRFPAGQPCFKASLHKVQNGRAPVLMVKRDGLVQVQDSDRWLTEFNDELYRANQVRKQGSYSGGGNDG